MNTLAALDELMKLGAISDAQARDALAQLDKVEQNKPTLGQLGRYAGAGAVAAPVIGAVGNLIAGKPLLAGKGAVAKLRGVAGQMVTGGLSGSALPIARTALDQHAHVTKLRKYLEQERPPVQVAPPSPNQTNPMRYTQ